MEIVTTLVKFRCRKDKMMEQSRNAQIFLFEGKDWSLDREDDDYLLRAQYCYRLGFVQCGYRYV